jgi:cytochrome d ubiquinol oxidase subunit I
MNLDGELLSRLQFAITVGFHFIFPPISIGLAWLLMVIEFVAWRKKDELYTRIGKFFGKLLGLTFVLGVATGIVMEFQFGMNWANYSVFVGDVFGAPLAAEGILAFFLESGFLGLYLFGRKRVSPGVHWFSIAMVAAGATISAFWILVANSWQQTPAGYSIQNGQAVLTDFWAMVFNPSTVVRFFHTIDAALITGAFFMAGISAYLMLKNKETKAAGSALKLAIIVGAVVSLLELFPFGDSHTRQVAITQPEKFASIEGITHTTSQAPLLFFGIPKDNPPEVLMRIELPALASFLAFGNINAEVQGLDSFPPGDTPPFILTFTSFHLMVGLGMLFILAMLCGVWRMWRQTLFHTGWYLKLLVLSIPLPVIACQLGWITAEVGRQPWIVYHLLKTKDAFSPVVSAGEVLFSTILFSMMYLPLGALYIYLLARTVKNGIEPAP